MRAVGDELAQKFFNTLTKHGATHERQSDIPDEMGAFYKITFPDGTVKQSGLLVFTAQNFEIQFPDGFILYGMDQYTPEESRVILFLPTE